MKREQFKAPNRRGLWNRIKRRMNRGKAIKLVRPISIFVTTKCNLNCYSCAALGMDPRPNLEDTRLEDIELFLRAMKERNKGETVMFTGGEPTLYPYLGEAAHLARSLGFLTSMLTNGVNLVPPEWFDVIILDKHSVNSDQIQLWEEMLNGKGIKYEVREKQYHQDIPYAMEDNVTKGARCANWLKPLVLRGDIVYPCCNILCVEWWHGTEDVTVALRESGWTVNNPDLVDTIEDWRETLPSEFYRVCTLKCWKDSSRARWVEIT